MKVEGLTILVQGPLKEDSACLDFIENYQKYGNVVVSCYDDNHDGIRKVTNQFKDVDILYAKTDVTDKFSQGIGFCKDSTFIWALYTMLRGFYHINSKYTLKVRSDEGYEYLDDFINMFLENDEKVICGNIFYKVESEHKLHMGDHIFIEAVRNIFFMYLKNDSFEPDKTLYERQGEANLCAETILARSILRQMNPDIAEVTGLHEEQQFFLDNILSYDSNGFKKFIARWNHANRTFKNKFDANVYLRQ